MKNDAKLVCAIANGMGEANPTYLYIVFQFRNTRHYAYISLGLLAWP
jgi:hypothetical protein